MCIFFLVVYKQYGVHEPKHCLQRVCNKGCSPQLRPYSIIFIIGSARGLPIKVHIYNFIVSRDLLKVKKYSKPTPFTPINVAHYQYWHTIMIMIPLNLWLTHTNFGLIVSYVQTRNIKSMFRTQTWIIVNYTFLISTSYKKYQYISQTFTISYFHSDSLLIYKPL